MKLFGNHRGAEHAAGRPLPRWLRVVMIVCAAVLLLSGSVFAAWKLLVRPAERKTTDTAGTVQSQPTEEQQQTPSVIHVTPKTEQADEETEETVETEQPASLREGIYNILICGTDDDGTRTDTIIIAHLDTTTHSVALLSIPRDTPVTAGSGLMKINSVYGGAGAEGMERLSARLEELLGFPVDGYVLVDLDAFKKTVDLVGGVEFDVPQDMDYEDASQDLYIHLKAGLQRLDGEKAMELVRFRKGYASQDIQRTQVQQQFLKALAKQCLSVSSLSKLKEFADIFAEDVTTDLTVGNMIWYGKELLDCDFDSMQMYTAEGEGAMINGAAYYPLYAGRLLEIVNQSFNPYDTAISAASLHVITPEAPEEPEEPAGPEEPAESDVPEEPAAEDPFEEDNFWTDDGQT